MDAAKGNASARDPVISTDSQYQNINANGQSRLHNGHVFNTTTHSMYPVPAIHQKMSAQH
jgi:hypothetical protein